MRTLPWFLWLITAAIVAIAVLPLPYGYYTFTRIVICGFCGYLAYLSWTEQKSEAWTGLFGLTALIFNPLIPIHMTRASWFWVDLGTAVFIAAHLFIVRLKKDSILPPDAA